MPHLDVRLFLRKDRADEVALARLGAAAVLLWDRIEPDLRNQLLSLAPFVAGVSNAPDCEAALGGSSASIVRSR